MTRVLLTAGGLALLSMLVVLVFALGAHLGYRRGREDRCDCGWEQTDRHAAANREKEGGQ